MDQISYLIPAEEQPTPEEHLKVIKDLLDIDPRDPLIRFREQYPHLPDCVIQKLAEEEINYYKSNPITQNKALLNRQERRQIARQLKKNKKSDV